MPSNTNNPSSKRIIFFQVNTTELKLKKIVETAIFHFDRSENFQIFVPDKASLKFVDELLWKIPYGSFIPHSTDEGNTSEKIVVTTIKQNLNNASGIFNLCSEDITTLLPSCNIIYELEDMTSSLRQKLSHDKYKKYKELGITIEQR
jgi:DNA polymerase IIIc chi subunit